MKNSNKKQPKRRQKRAVHDLDLYHQFHEAYHRELRKARWGITHERYGFPILLRDGVCAADPDMGHASGIVIDQLPCNLKGKDVLDVGCGSGVISIAVAYRGANVVASDYSPKAVDLTLHNLGENPEISDQVLVFQSDVFQGVKRELPEQKYDFVLANLWFPIARNGFERETKDALECYRRYLGGVKDMLKPDGVACLTSGAAADSAATMRLMDQAAIQPQRTVVQKNHFDGQVAMNWHLYSFDKNGQPATLRR